VRVAAFLVAALVLAPNPSGVGAQQQVIVQIQRSNDRLLSAAYEGDVPTMTKRLNAGVDINMLDASRMTPLMNAAEGQQAAAIRLLLSRGAEVLLTDAEGHDAYWFATHRRIWGNLPVIGRFYIPLPRFTTTESATLLEAAMKRRLATLAGRR
jgi:hypothetical protein